MRQVYRTIKLFFVRNYEAIKLGLLAAIFVTTILMLDNQARTLQEVLNVNEQIKIVLQNDNNDREEAREQSKSRDEIIIQYLKCIALIRPENRTQDNIQSCVDNAKVKTSTGEREISSVPAQPVIPPQQSTPPRAQEVTTSEPPEPKQTGLIDSITNTVKDTVDSVLNIL